MAQRTARTAAVGASTLFLVFALVACAPETGASPSEDAGASGSASPTPIATVTAAPSPSPTAQAEIPDDCEAMLTADVLAQLEDVPLNDPAFGETGPQSDGGLICVWRDPRADTTGIMTTLTYMSRGPALDLLNGLADDEDFTCYTPDGGTRCEKSWDNPTYPVTDGRTLFWRDDILIDTVYSNLAPDGYTSAIVETVFG